MSSSTEPPVVPGEQPGPDPSLPYDQPVQPVQPPMSDAELTRPYRPATPIAAVELAPNPAGRTSLIIGIVITVLSLGQQIAVSVIPALLYRAGGDVVGVSQATFAVSSVVIGVLALVGTAIGITGLTRRGSHRLAAAAGTAIAVTTLLGIVVALAVSALVGFLY